MARRKTVRTRLWPWRLDKTLFKLFPLRSEAEGRVAGGGIVEGVGGVGGWWGWVGREGE